jgi:hypothetical protein
MINIVESDFNLNGLRESIALWLEEMAKDLEPGRFRFCSQGNLVPVTGRAAQVSTCFAMKTAWQIGVWKGWPEERKRGCIEFVSSFQRKDGSFYDPWLFRNARLSWRNYASAILGRTSWDSLWRRKEWNLRAETRQSASTLLMVGSQPVRKLSCDAVTIDQIKNYISTFDWTIPWSAGSNTAHLMFMLFVNRTCFSEPENYNLLIEVILEELEKYYDSDTGTWFSGSPPDNIKINGAMKILAGFQWIDKIHPDSSKLLHFALSQEIKFDGCGFLNRLFVVHQARKGIIKKDFSAEVQSLGQKVFSEIKKFQKPDGAFSFYPDKSQVSYYYAKVTKGLPVSDLHGTVMLSWAVAIALDLLGDQAPKGSENWTCQIP